MRDRMYLDAMAEVYGNSSKVLLDVEGGNQMMYLPLDQMLRAGSTGKADNTSPGLPDLVPGSSGMGGSNTEDARSRARSR
jgi:membrane protease subunit HflK